MARPKKYDIRTVDDLTHQRWCGMHTRVCHQERHKHAEICAEWFDYVTFKKDMGACPKGYSLERDNNDFGYNPSNCRWIPLEDQSNNRRGNIMIGKLSLKRACELAGEPYKTVWHRVKRQGMQPIEAILYRIPKLKQPIIRELLT